MVTQAGGREEALVLRLVRGMVAGVVAGMVFAGVTMWFTTTMGDPADMPLHMISTIVLGAGAMEAGTTSVGVGLAVHMVLSALFGLVFALAVPALRTNGTVALVGTGYGALLYVVNFLILAPIAFPVFQMANQPFELFAHVVFGTLLSFAFFGSGARRAEHVISVGRGVGRGSRQQVGT
ncbi:MAG: hypothetical protein GEV03_14335 [Streptosporangiales bacterium]|nr:hypothetical protein [Streptosporangiales bacterium]